MSTSVPMRRRQHAQRIAVVLLALLVYLGLDGAAALSARSIVPWWGLRLDKQGTITWVAPNSPAYTDGLRVGDRVLQPSGTAGMAYAQALYRQDLLVQRRGMTRHIRVRALPSFGPTRRGQTFILVGALLLLVGVLSWAYGRTRRTPALLGVLSVVAALTLLGSVWNDSYNWALHLSFVAGVVFFPITWAVFFLSFPGDCLALRHWRISFAVLCALALVTLAAYVLCLLAGQPYTAAHGLGSLNFALGLLLGLSALFLREHEESAQVRQQRQIVAFSAAGAMLPVLLFSFAPSVVAGQPLVPYEATTLALVILPLGLAYAIVRYDLMELDVVVRRAVAAVLGGFILIAATMLATVALRPLLRGLDPAPLMIAVLAGAASGGYVRRWSHRAAERLLSPELVRSRRLVGELREVLLRGEEDLPAIAAHLEQAAVTATDATWARLLVRRRAPGALFFAPGDEATHLAIPLLTAALTRRAWGLTPAEGRDGDAPDEWRELSCMLSSLPSLVAPVRVSGEVIAVLAVGSAAPVNGPDREVLAVLLAQAALAIDHARVQAELEAEGAAAAALSAASMRLTSTLDDRPALAQHIVEAIGVMRDVQSVALALYDHDGALAIVAASGEQAPVTAPDEPGTTVFTLEPTPSAWLPLMVGETVIGALSMRWHEPRVIREHDRRLLGVYANSAAMALEHARLYERARIQAERDPVTDLYNHRAFHARLEAALGRAREAGGSAAVLLIDVADFKLFNDTHGHQAGDQALRRVGEVLQFCCRDADAAARLGGDEFAVLLPDATIDVAYAVAGRIAELASASAVTSPDGRDLPVRLSIGLAVFPIDARAANALLACADERMYAAKRAGVAMTMAGQDPRQESADSGGRFGMLEALVAMVDNRDRYTGEHSEQVATYACAIAGELGLSHETIATLRLAGLLHDVGKIGVPDRILRKPDRLTPEEHDVVKRHVELSEALVAVVSQDHDLLDAVRYHHERWDGNGYPRGVAGEDVPLIGRIMIVADAVSAMGMDRPYRKGLSWATIAQELARGASTQFDPALVRIALRVLRPHIERAHDAA